jgi:hypothetical protein
VRDVDNWFVIAYGREIKWRQRMLIFERDEPSLDT